MKCVGGLLSYSTELLALHCANASADAGKPVGVAVDGHGRVWVGVNAEPDNLDDWIGTFSAKGGVLKMKRQLRAEFEDVLDTRVLTPVPMMVAGVAVAP